MLTKANIVTEIRKYYIFLFPFLFLLLQSCASVQLNYDNLFEKIATYDYGQDRTNLTDLSKKISLFSQKDETRAIVEKDLLDFLKTDATFASKQFVCRELRIIGSEESISGLSELLESDKTSDIARYALEKIPGNAVDAMLVDLIPEVSKKVKIGIINTLGVRESKIAVPTLAKLLDNGDSNIAIAAASALGKIGIEDCMIPLESILTSHNSPLKDAATDSYLLCIDKLANKNKLATANKYYTKMFKMNLSSVAKQATLTGIINTSSSKTKEIFNRIKQVPSDLKFIPISKIREISNINDIADFGELLPILEPANQIQLLSVFEDKSVKSVRPYILESLNSNDVSVRIASLRTLASIGDKNDVLELAKVAANRDGDESFYAERALDLLNSSGVDKTIVDNLSTSKDEIKAQLIRAIGTRNIKSAFNDITGFTNYDNNLVRNQSFKTLSSLSVNENLPSLYSLLLKEKNTSNKKKIERIISKVITENPSKNNASVIIEKYNKSKEIENKTSLLRIMGFTNHYTSLELLKKETKNRDNDIKLAATIGMSNWSTAVPIKDLENILTSTNNNNIKKAAFKGFVKFIGIDTEISLEEKVVLYQIALDNATTSNERNLALEGIGHTDCFESLEAVKPFINQADVKQTVDDAINRVSWHLHKQDPDRVKEYVNWFLTKIKDEKFQNKNQSLIKAIDKLLINKNNDR